MDNSLLIKNISVKIKNSKWFQEKVDILINNNKIIEINNKILGDYLNTVDAQGAELFLPMIDAYATSGEPSYSGRESLQSLINAAKNGGFSGLFHFPSSNNFIDSKTDISYLKNLSNKSDFRIYIIANMQKASNPEMMTEIREMQQLGAIGFTNLADFKLSSDFLNRTIQYAKSTLAKLIFHPENILLSKGGQINQGSQSLRMGYKGMPASAEYLALQEILEICKYNKYSPIIIDISCEESLETIQKYRKFIDIQVGCNISNLFFNEINVSEYDTNFKLNPPLRSEKDQKALIDAVKNKTINFLYSQHLPWTPEEKMIEFDRAEFGTASTESALSAALNLFDTSYKNTVLDCFSTNIYKAFGLEIPELTEGENANFAMIIDKKWSLDSKSSKSKSKSNAYYNISFNKKVCLLAEFINIS